MHRTHGKVPFFIFTLISYTYTTQTDHMFLPITFSCSHRPKLLFNSSLLLSCLCDMYVCVPVPLAKAWAQDYSWRRYFCFNPSMDNLLVEQKKPSLSEPIINGQQLPKEGGGKELQGPLPICGKILIDPILWRSYASHSYCELTGVIVLLGPCFLHFFLHAYFFFCSFF